MDYKEKMDLTESEEMYLETILVLSIRNSEVRSIDIAKEMDFSKPSVSIAMKKLKSMGLINMDDNLISLTEMGAKIAKGVYEKHNVLASILKYLGVNESLAIDDACKIEHQISDESFNKLKDYFRPLLERK